MLAYASKFEVDIAVKRTILNQVSDHMILWLFYLYWNDTFVHLTLSHNHHLCLAEVASASLKHLTSSFLCQGLRNREDHLRAFFFLHITSSNVSIQDLERKTFVVKIQTSGLQ